MNRSSLLILIFAVIFAVFFISPPLLSGECSLYTLMKTGDVVDILTPLVLLPLYWLLFRRTGQQTAGLAGIIAFTVLAGLWAMGHGMHLSANSIKHLMEGAESTDVYKLTNFYDEQLSHYLWHAGIAGLSALIIYTQWRHQPVEKVNLWVIIPSAIIHGFTFFVIVIEAGTAPLGITFIGVALMFCGIWCLRLLGKQPVLTFFMVSYVVALLFFAGWSIYYQDLPQFSELGII